MNHDAAPREHVSRRHILQILTAVGIGGAAAEALAAEAAPTVSPAALRSAALLSGTFDERRLEVAQAAVQRNLDQLQAVRDLDSDDAVEPGVIFEARRG